MSETPEQRADRERRERCARLALEIAAPLPPLSAPSAPLGATIPGESATITTPLQPLFEGRYSEDQPRDSDGKFASGGGGPSLGEKGKFVITASGKVVATQGGEIHADAVGGPAELNAILNGGGVRVTQSDKIMDLELRDPAAVPLALKAVDASSAEAFTIDVTAKTGTNASIKNVAYVDAKGARRFLNEFKNGTGSFARSLELRYSEDQPRDEKGRFGTSMGGDWKDAKNVGAAREKEYKRLAEAHDAIFYDPKRLGQTEYTPVPTEASHRDLAQWQQPKLTNLHSQIEDARTRLGMKEKNDTLEVAGRVLTNARVDMNAKQWFDATTGQDRALYLMHTVILGMGGHTRSLEELQAEFRAHAVGVQHRWLRQPGLHYTDCPACENGDCLAHNVEFRYSEESK